MMALGLALAETVILSGLVVRTLLSRGAVPTTGGLTTNLTTLLACLDGVDLATGKLALGFWDICQSVIGSQDGNAYRCQT